MSIAHDLQPLSIFDMNRGRRRQTRRCSFCHVDEAYIEVDRCPVRAAGEAGKAATDTALEVALEAELMPAPVAATPRTVTGLRQYDHLSPDEALAAAWANAGPDPQWHLAAQTHLRDTMPVVHRAILRIVERVREEEVL
jgi:hypothetical protein